MSADEVVFICGEGRKMNVNNNRRIKIFFSVI
jgi:hypothetical protein